LELLRVVAWGSVERAEQQANPNWCQFVTDSKVMMHIKMMYVCISDQLVYIKMMYISVIAYIKMMYRSANYTSN